MRTQTPVKLAYEAPETSVDLIEQEECFLQSNLKDMSGNDIFDEFDDEDD